MSSYISSVVNLVRQHWLARLKNCWCLFFDKFDNLLNGPTKLSKWQALKKRGTHCSSPKLGDIMSTFVFDSHNPYRPQWADENQRDQIMIFFPFCLQRKHHPNLSNSFDQAMPFLLVTRRLHRLGCILVVYNRLRSTVDDNLFALWFATSRLFQTFSVHRL